MCEIYSQTKTLISSLGSDYKASDNGDGVRVECHRYIYHRIMDTIMSTKLCFLSQSEDRTYAFTDQWQGWRNILDEWGVRGLYRKSRFHEMLFDELWSSNWHLGSTLRKETRAQSLQSQSWAEPEMGNFKRILYGPVNEASGPEIHIVIKYQLAFYYQGSPTCDGSEIRSGDVKRMSGWHVISGHYVNQAWQQTAA